MAVNPGGRKTYISRGDPIINYNSKYFKDFFRFKVLPRRRAISTLMIRSAHLCLLQSMQFLLTVDETLYHTKTKTAENTANIKLEIDALIVIILVNYNIIIQSDNI